MRRVLLISGLILLAVIVLSTAFVFLLRPDLDLDNDLFEDTLEHNYLALYYYDPAELDTSNPSSLCSRWIADPNLHPPESLRGKDISSVPTSTLSIHVEGQGSVTPPAGTDYVLARYSMDCGEPCSTSSPHPCADSPHVITLTATPAKDWAFEGWYGLLPEDLGDVANPNSPSFDGWKLVNPTDPNPTRPLKMDKDRGIFALFVYRPGAGNPQTLIDDLEVFLRQTGLYKQGDKILNLDFDRGRRQRDKVYFEEHFVGNDIPDAAEFALLQYILDHRALDFSIRHGASNYWVWEDHAENLEQAGKDLKGQPDSVIHTVAAYMTLGYWESVLWVDHAANEYFGVDLDRITYAHGSADCLGPDKDADCDGLSNEEEWELAKQHAQGDPSAALQNYGRFATNGTPSPTQ